MLLHVIHGTEQRKSSVKVTGFTFSGLISCMHNVIRDDTADDNPHTCSCKRRLLHEDIQSEIFSADNGAVLLASFVLKQQQRVGEVENDRSSLSYKSFSNYR